MGGRWTLKIPTTAAGIEPGTFRFVAQHLNHCATAVPLFPQLKCSVSLFSIVLYPNSCAPFIFLH